MPRLARTTTAADSGSQSLEAADGAAAFERPQNSGTPRDRNDDFETSLRSHDEIIERMEAVIQDPSRSVPSRHHPPPADQ